MRPHDLSQGKGLTMARPVRVLVVDDSALFQRLFQDILSQDPEIILDIEGGAASMRSSARRKIRCGRGR